MDQPEQASDQHAYAYKVTTVLFHPIKFTQKKKECGCLFVQSSSARAQCLLPQSAEFNSDLRISPVNMVFHIQNFMAGVIAEFKSVVHCQIRVFSNLLRCISIDDMCGVSFPFFAAAIADPS